MKKTFNYTVGKKSTFCPIYRTIVEKLLKHLFEFWRLKQIQILI